MDIEEVISMVEKDMVKEDGVESMVEEDNIGEDRDNIEERDSIIDTIIQIKNTIITLEMPIDKVNYIIIYIYGYILF